MKRRVLVIGGSLALSFVLLWVQRHYYCYYYFHCYYYYYFYSSSFSYLLLLLFFFFLFLFLFPLFCQLPTAQGSPTSLPPPLLNDSNS